MTPTLAHLLVRLFPKPWRARYGAEFVSLLQAGPEDLRTFINVALAALSENIVPTIGGTMTQSVPSIGAITKQPSAFLPLTMSVFALAIVLFGPFLFGDLHATDEGPSAHLWQLLIAGQLPLLAFFALKWLPRATRPTIQVLGLQAGALVLNFALVFYLKR